MAGGLDEVRGKILRIGHMGATAHEEIVDALLHLIAVACQRPQTRLSSAVMV